MCAETVATWSDSAAWLLSGSAGTRERYTDYMNFICNKTTGGRREPPYIVFPEPASHGYAKCGFPPIRKLP
jgi:hypothetical protein